MGKTQTKLRNWKLTIKYDGGAFYGWQRQAEARSVQGTLEQTLSELLKEEVRITGAGRTDAGVHATGQTANFHTRSTLDGEAVQREANHMLPDDIAISGIELVPNCFHSRFDAKAKTYDYHIDFGERPSVFRRKYSAHVAGRADPERMRQAAALLLGRHDFRGYSTAANDEKSTIKTIYRIDVIEEGQYITIRVTGDGFLYHMMRLIAGMLVDVGLGVKTAEDAAFILAGRDRTMTDRLMTGSGLFLRQIYY